MPWWSWILLWIALVSLSLLFYAVLGFRLFRQIVTTFKELGAAGDKLGQSASRLGEDDLSDPSDPPVESSQWLPPGAAIFASPEQMKHEYHTSKRLRQEARRQRRIRRKAERGQPQRLRDIEFR
jgi:hypothetical protein